MEIGAHFYEHRGWVTKVRGRVGSKPSLFKLELGLNELNLSKLELISGFNALWVVMDHCGHTSNLKRNVALIGISKGIYVFLPYGYVYFCICVILEQYDHVSGLYTSVYDRMGKIVFSNMTHKNWTSVEDIYVCVYWCTHPCMVNAFEFWTRINFATISKTIFLGNDIHAHV